MSAPDLPIIRKLTRKSYRRETWHEPYGTIDIPCDPDDEGAEAFDRNPDGPEAAGVIKGLYDALVIARHYVLIHSDDDGEIEQIDNALSRARGEEVRP